MDALGGSEVDLRTASLRARPTVRSDHPVRPAARPRRDEPTQQAAMVGDPAVAAFGRPRNPRDERRRDAAVRQERKGRGECGAGAEPRGPGGSSRAGSAGWGAGAGRRCAGTGLRADDQMPGSVALFNAEVREKLVRLRRSKGQGTERVRSGRPSPPTLLGGWGRSAALAAPADAGTVPCEEKSQTPFAEAAVGVVNDGRSACHLSSVEARR